MLFLELVGWVFAFTVFLLVLTQIVMPFLFNTPFFPLFRKETDLKHQVDVAEQELAETTELVRLKARLFALNQEQVALEKRIAETAVTPTQDK